MLPRLSPSPVDGKMSVNERIPGNTSSAARMNLRNMRPSFGASRGRPSLAGRAMCSTRKGCESEGKPGRSYLKNRASASLEPQIDHSCDSSLRLDFQEVENGDRLFEKAPPFRAPQPLPQHGSKLEGHESPIERKLPFIEDLPCLSKERARRFAPSPALGDQSLDPEKPRDQPRPA